MTSTPKPVTCPPLVAAGLFYLLLTVPLTHLVNVIDERLRTGRQPAPPVQEEMI